MGYINKQKVKTLPENLQNVVDTVSTEYTNIRDTYKNIYEKVILFSSAFIPVSFGIFSLENLQSIEQYKYYFIVGNIALFASIVFSIFYYMQTEKYFFNLAKRNLQETIRELKENNRITPDTKETEQLIHFVPFIAMFISSTGVFLIFLYYLSVIFDF